MKSTFLIITVVLIDVPFLILTAKASPPPFTFCDPEHCSKADIILQGYFSFNGVDKTTTCYNNQTFCHLFMRGFTFHAGMANQTDPELEKILSQYWNTSDPNSQ